MTSPLLKQSAVESGSFTTPEPSTHPYMPWELWKGGSKCSRTDGNLCCILSFHCPCTGPWDQHQQFPLGPRSTAQGQQTQQAKCALLYSAVPHSFGHKSYSPKEAMKTSSWSRQMRPFIHSWKIKICRRLRFYCTLLLAQVRFSPALIHQFNTFAINSAMLVNNYLQVRNFRDSPSKNFFVFY